MGYVVRHTPFLFIIIAPFIWKVHILLQLTYQMSY